MLTRVPFATLLPGCGLSEITSPLGTAALDASDTTGLSPAALRRVTAACSVCLVTSGTLTLRAEPPSTSASAAAAAISATASAASSRRPRAPCGG